MCFSAAANFVGSGALATIGVVTLTRVKHRRELLFASLPTLFAIHQFIEGFVWLGLDGMLSPKITHNMGAAFMLYAQGLLPFLLPLSVSLFEPDAKSRRRMLPFLVIGTLTADRLSDRDFCQGQQHRVYQSGDEQYLRCDPLCHSDLRFAVVLEGQRHGDLRNRESGNSPGGDGGEAICIHVLVVRLCSDRKRDHPRLLLEEQPTSPFSVRRVVVEARRLKPHRNPVSMQL
jgi:hypothetical protein